MQAIQQRSIDLQFKKSGHPPYIEKPLKGLENLSKGNLFEQEASKFLYSFGIPVLISSAFLRELGAGQVDYAFYNQKEIYLVELKSHGNGLTISQYNRLKKSILVLGEIFSCDVRLWTLNYLPKN